MWKVLRSESLLDHPKVKVVEETVSDFKSAEREVIRVQSHPYGYVMVVPVQKMENGQFKFVMVQQYRHVIGVHQLEFPAGKMEYGETGEMAAIRELKEETGYDAKNIKFLYTTFVGGSYSNEKIMFYVAEVEGKPGKVNYTDRELGSEMKVVELTSDEVHKLVINNELTNMATMTALLVLMLQNSTATKYLMYGEGK